LGRGDDRMDGGAAVVSQDSCPGRKTTDRWARAVSGRKERVA
jgi:hypothetical protein